MSADQAQTAAPHGVERVDLTIIGGGLRSAVLLLQLGTFPAEEAPRRIAVVDPEEPGPGRIWRQAQPTLLVMNTLGHQSTVFEDHTNTGPSLAEWCHLVRGTLSTTRDHGWPAGLISHCAMWIERHPGDHHRVRAATQGLPDESYFPRAVFGAYLAWAYDYAVHRLSEHTTVVHFRDRAVDVEEPELHTRDDAPAEVVVHLGSGAVITSLSVILAQGWGLAPVRPSTGDGDRAPSRHLSADSPIDQDVARIAPDSDVLIRGMGMSMFDTLTLLTQGRGGTFEQRGNRWEYQVSGKEPRILIGSRRGLPFRAQAAPSGRPVQPETPHLLALMSQLPEHGVDFSAVREAIDRDAIRRFYRVRYAATPREAYSLLIRAIDQGGAIDEWRELEARLVHDPTLRFPDLTDAGEVPRYLTTAQAYTGWVHEMLTQDIADASLGERSPGKMAMEVYVAARMWMSDIAGFGRLSARTYPDFLATMRFIGAVGGVPPLFRVQELDALLRAGVVRMFGPDTEITALRGTRFEVRSRYATRTVDAVIDAFLPRPGIDVPGDSLAVRLAARGAATRYRYADAIPTDALAVGAETNALIRADGTASTRVFSVGISSEAARVFTIIAPVPGTASPVLRECRAALTAAVGYALRNVVIA